MVPRFGWNVELLRRGEGLHQSVVHRVLRHLVRSRIRLAASSGLVPFRHSVGWERLRGKVALEVPVIAFLRVHSVLPLCVRGAWACGLWRSPILLVSHLCMSLYTVCGSIHFAITHCIKRFAVLNSITPHILVQLEWDYTDGITRFLSVLSWYASISSGSMRG